MKKTKKMNFKHLILPIVSLGMVASITACNIFERGTWTWEASTAGFNINYCLLIGQLDHNDSAARTQGIREKLNTRTDDEEARKKAKGNANLEPAKLGFVEFDDDRGQHTYYKVHELEAMEQKSLAGATWDQVTANGTASVWMSKYGSRLTAIISNNDGMAEGALYAANMYNGMPIFGYDANSSTLRLVKDERIKGTIDSVSPAQCTALYLLARNVVDKRFGPDSANPNPTIEGFDADHKIVIDGNELYMQTFIDKTSVKPDGNNAVLIKNKAVVPAKYKEKGGEDFNKVDDYFDAQTGQLLDTAHLLEKAEPHVKKGSDGKSIFNNQINVYQTYYNNADTYLSSTMKPNFALLADIFNIKVTEFSGDGSDEASILNAIDTTGGKYNAYLLNPVKQENSRTYIERIARANNLQPKANWEERSDIPVIFYNRQPPDEEGKSLEPSMSVMHNDYFKYTFYVGFSAMQGGELQGDMVRNFFVEEHNDHN